METPTRINKNVILHTAFDDGEKINMQLSLKIYKGWAVANLSCDRNMHYCKRFKRYCKLFSVSPKRMQNIIHQYI